MNQPPPTKTVTLKDGSTITMFWSRGLGCYVTVPRDNELRPGLHLVNGQVVLRRTLASDTTETE